MAQRMSIKFNVHSHTNRLVKIVRLPVVSAAVHVEH